MPSQLAVIKGKGSTSNKSSNCDTIAGDMTCTATEAITTRAELTTLIAGQAAILIVVWITTGIMAAGGQIIIPVIGTVGHIDTGTAFTRAATTFGVHTGTRRHGATTTPNLD